MYKGDIVEDVGIIIQQEKYVYIPDLSLITENESPVISSGV